MEEYRKIIEAALARFPNLQAIYLFGGHGTADERPESDVDVAILLEPREAKAAGPLAMSDLRFELERMLKRDVDLINLREVSTVLQKEVVLADRRIHTAAEYASEEFEMLALSFYQKLNEERAEILAEAAAGKRLYDP